MQGLILFISILFYGLALDPESDIINQKFVGLWKSTSQPFGYLDKTTGNVEIIFGNQQLMLSRPTVNTVEFTLLDPQYHSYKTVKFRIPLNNYSSNTRQWGGNTVITYYLFQEGTKMAQYTCNSYFEVQMMFTNQRTQEEYQFAIHLATHDTSPECNFDMTAETVPHSNQIKVFYYCIFISSLSAISLVSLLIFYKKYSESLRMMKKISIKCVLVVLLQLWYLILVHLYLLIIQKDNYGFFMIPIILIGIQSSITLALLLSAFRFKYQNNLTTKKWLLLVMALCISFTGYVILMYLYPYDILTVLLQSCVAIFQIVKNFKHHKKVKISGYYFIGCFQMQLILGLYYRGCPSNIFSVEPSIGFIFFWISIHALQLVVLLVQRSIGGRFFIPQCILRYNTGYALMKEDKSQEECGICIGTLCINQQFAHTKCGHSYHQFCLKQWLKVNEKCPMCRTKIQQQF